MSEFKAEFYENGDEIPVKEFWTVLTTKCVQNSQWKSNFWKKKAIN